MRRIRRLDETSKRPVPIGDGLDGPAWDLLVEAVEVAHRVDPDAFRAAITRLDGVKAEDPRAGIYLWHLLELRTRAVSRPGAGGAMTEDELRALAHEYWPFFRRLIKADEDSLATIYLAAWHLETGRPDIAGMKFVTFGIAALSVLLEKPRAELAEMRPRVAEWYHEIRPEIRIDLGPFDTGPSSGTN